VRRSGLTPMPNSAILKTGIYDGEPALLLHDRIRHLYVLKTGLTENILTFEHEDQALLERFFSAAIGAIDWSI